MGRVEPTAVERRTSDFVAVCTSDSRVSELSPGSESEPQCSLSSLAFL